MKKTALFVLSLFLVLACNRAQPDPVTEASQPADSLSQPKLFEADTVMWAGTYKGVTPCQDCDGIETTLTIKTDNTYALQLRFLGKTNTQPVEATGRFRWLPGSNSIKLDGLLNMPSQYSVGQNMLMQMDGMGQPITGETAAQYILIKQKTQYITIMKE